jgi:hypothetical protein
LPDIGVDPVAVVGICVAGFAVVLSIVAMYLACRDGIPSASSGDQEQTGRPADAQMTWMPVQMSEDSQTFVE